ncbi:MAG: hypothetical protein V3T53_09205 [Phycisphaerales bacterium]
MNPTDNNSDPVATLIKEAATTFQPSAELKDSVRKRVMGMDIASGEEPQPKRVSPRRRMLFRSWRLASAASVAILATGAIVALLFWPTSLTMAQMQEAIESVAWVHLQYDNGEELWISPRKRIRASSRADGSVGFTDYKTGVQHIYRGLRSTQNIFERQLEPWDSPRSAWDVIVGYLEERADEPGGNGRFEAERHTVIVDGRRLVRFDSYVINAFDKQLLVKQVWADPATRLPVRVRRRLQRRDRQNPDQVFGFGLFTFPDSGPESIYDLGAPKELIVVKPDTSEPKQQVVRLLDAIRAAERRFLANYRVIVWQNERRSGINVLHFSGRPELEELTDKYTWLDYRGVKIRLDNFFNLDSDYPEYHLPLPATAEQVLAWSRTQTPVDLYLSDGERSYSQDGPMPPMFPDPDKVFVRVDRVHGPPGFPSTNFPTRYQWPTAHRVFGSPLQTLETTPSDPPGTIGLRTTYGNQRYDFFIDPRRDHICLRQIQWERRGNDWFKRRETTLDGLVQLPSGHWVATERQIYTGGSPERNIRPRRSTWLIHIEELDPERIPPDTFDGELLLKKARELGATIEAY